MRLHPLLRSPAQFRGRCTAGQCRNVFGTGHSCWKMFPPVPTSTWAVACDGGSRESHTTTPVCGMCVCVVCSVCVCVCVCVCKVCGVCVCEYVWHILSICMSSVVHLRHVEQTSTNLDHFRCHQLLTVCSNDLSTAYRDTWEQEIHSQWIHKHMGAGVHSQWICYSPIVNR